jgi:hypothetical protein
MYRGRTCGRHDEVRDFFSCFSIFFLTELTLRQLFRSAEFALAIAAPLIMYACRYRCLNTISPARRTDLASVYRYSSAIIFVGIAIGAWCRTATFNNLPSICAKFGTDAYSWQVRSPKIVCGQLSLKRCVIQVVPRPGALLEVRRQAVQCFASQLISFSQRAKNEESQLEQGEVISINDEDACIICFAHKINTSLAPCGHKVVCSECASKVSTCPMCRGKIEKLESFNPAASSATETTATTTSDSESTAVELSDMVDEEL